MELDHGVDFLLACGENRLLDLLARMCALNKRRINRDQLIAAVIEGLLKDYDNEGRLGELSVFEARGLQLLHDSRLLQKLKDRQAKSRRSGLRLERSIRSLEDRLEELKSLEGPASLQYLARLYLRDIAPDFNPVFFLLFRALARRLFNNFIKSIRALESEKGVFAAIRARNGTQPVFYIANHISNADHLPILFALNWARLQSPVVIGGSNLYRGVSAKILPKVNVCQLKRDDMIEKKIKWLGNPIYIETFKAHNQYMWEHNEPYLFYPEGGRSRSGKILRPKLGIIKNIFEFIRGSQQPACFVPMSLSYTCVPEDLAIEAGRQGSNITDGDLIQQLTTLNREYAAFASTPIYVNLGKPIQMRAEDLPGIEDFSRKLLHLIRDNIIITPTYELAAMILEQKERSGRKTIFSWQNLADSSSRLSTGELQNARAVFVRKGFIREDSKKTGSYEVINPELIAQYANRSQCDF